MLWNAGTVVYLRRLGLTMSQHHPHLHSSATAFYTDADETEDDNNPALSVPAQYPYPYPTPPATLEYSASINPFQHQASELPPPITAYPYTFSPTQLSALIDERIRNLGSIAGAAQNDGDTDMEWSGVNFATLNRCVQDAVLHSHLAMLMTGHTGSRRFSNPNDPPPLSAIPAINTSSVYRLARR